MHEVSQKFLQKLYINGNINNEFWGGIAQYVVLLFRLSQNSCDSSSWDNFAYNILSLKYDVDKIFGNIA